MDYHMERCPVCQRKTFRYISYSEYGYGIVEQHGYCDSCGFCVEQAYSPVYECFVDLKRGIKSKKQYYPKNIKRHKRNRRKHMSEFVKRLQADQNMNRLLAMV